MKSRKEYKHKNEKIFFILSYVIALFIFAFLSYLGYEATLGDIKNNLILQILEIDSEFSVLVMKIGGYIAIVTILILCIKIIMVYENCKISAKAYDVHVTDKQFPMLIKAEEEYAKKLGIKKIPKIFVAREKKEIEFHGISIDNPYLIRIPCEKIISTAERDYFSAKFYIAKHLASIYLGYYNKVIFIILIFVRWVPIFNHVTNRLMEYSTDKVAVDLIGKDIVIDSIIEEAIDIWFIPYINKEEYIKNIKNVIEDKNMVWANMFSDIPIPAYRIDAIINDKDGKLL